MNPTIDLSPAMTSAEIIIAKEENRRDAIRNLLGESDISVTLLDGNTIYVNIGCAEVLYADGYAIKNGALYQTVD